MPRLAAPLALRTALALFRRRASARSIARRRQVGIPRVPTQLLLQGRHQPGQLLDLALELGDALVSRVHPGALIMPDILLSIFFFFGSPKRSKSGPGRSP